MEHILSPRRFFHSHKRVPSSNLVPTFDREEIYFSSNTDSTTHQPVALSPRKQNPGSTLFFSECFPYCSSPRGITRETYDIPGHLPEADVLENILCSADIPAVEREREREKAAALEIFSDVPQWSLPYPVDNERVPNFERNFLDAAVEENNAKDMQYIWRENDDPRRHRANNGIVEHFTCMEAGETLQNERFMMLENVEKEISVIPPTKRSEHSFSLPLDDFLPLRVDGASPALYASPFLNDKEVMSSVHNKMNGGSVCLPPHDAFFPTSKEKTTLSSVAPSSLTSDTVHPVCRVSAERNSDASNSCRKGSPGTSSSFASFRKNEKPKLPHSTHLLSVITQEHFPSFSVPKTDNSDKTYKSEYPRERSVSRKQKKAQKYERKEDLSRAPFSSSTWTSTRTFTASLNEGELRPMCRDTTIVEELTGAETLAVLRMRHVLLSFGDTEEYKLPPFRCHRMFLTKDEARQIYLLRKKQQEQEQQQLAKRCMNHTSSCAKTARIAVSLKRF